MRYYDLQKNWTKKIEPHLANKQLNNILVRDLNKRSSSQWGKPFVHGQYPWEYGEFEWMIERKGRPPRYWRYTQTGACHWLVNFNLKLATLVEPQQRAGGSSRLPSIPPSGTGQRCCSSSIFWPSGYRRTNALSARSRAGPCCRLGNSGVPIRPRTIVSKLRIFEKLALSARWCDGRAARIAVSGTSERGTWRRIRSEWPLIC